MTTQYEDQQSSEAVADMTCVQKMQNRWLIKTRIQSLKFDYKAYNPVWSIYLLICPPDHAEK